MIKFLLEKEFKQIFRNPFFPKLIVVFPCITLLLMPWAADFEVRKIRLAAVDNDITPLSRELTNRILSSGYFIPAAFPSSHEEALAMIESGSADAMMEIPSGFGRKTEKGENPEVFAAADALNSVKGSLAVSYISAIVSEFSADITATAGGGFPGDSIPSLRIVPYYRFNSRLDYKAFMVPALMVMLVTMLCGFLPALNIVAEKEAGTMEQINVTPVRKHIFIISKLIPYWIIGTAVVSLGFLIARLVYNLVPEGSLFVIYLFTAVYILTVSGFGLVISNNSRTMQQAMFVMYFFILIFILISGLFTPVSSMPGWARMITVFNPLRYYIEMMRAVYLKGSGFSHLLREFFILCGFALFFNIWAVASYRKNS